MTERLFILQPTVVFRAQFTEDFAVFPMGELPWTDLISGAFAAIEPEMLLRIGTGIAQDDHGRQRIRKAATADTLFIGRSSPGTNDGEVYPVTGDLIDVLNLRLPFAKIPFINGDGTIFEDHDIAWNEQTGSEKPPKSNITPEAFAGTISSGIITVDFDGTDSYVQADGATIATYLWDVDDGTITVGTSASSGITATFPAGFRYVSLTVTDSNGITHTMYVPVYARDPAADTTIGNYQIERRTYGLNGQTIALRILEDIPAQGYPDGTLVMLFEEPTGPTDNSCLFVGWHHSDPAQIAAGRTGILRDVVFECLDIAGKLNALPGFSVSVENKAAPASWLEMSGANMDRYIDRLLRWRSNAFELAYYTPSGTGADFPFVILGSDAQTLWQQATRRANALVPDYHLTCNSRGRLAVVPDPMLQETADRTSTVQATLTEADWSDIRYTHQRAPDVYWLRSEAILASATQIAALFTVAPDTTPGQGAVEQTHGEQLAKNHVDLMNAEGHRYARLNARQSHFTITLAEGDAKEIEPAALTWVQVTVSAATAAQRNLQLSTARGLVRQVDVAYQHGRTGTTKTVTLTWERETTGTPAAPFFPPETDFPDDWEPEPDGGFDPDPAPTTAGDGFGTFYATPPGPLARTRALSASSPEYADITGTTTGSPYDFILDPFRPTTRGWRLTDDGVFRGTDLDQVSPTWEHVLDATDVDTGTGATLAAWGMKIEASINQDGYIGLCVQTGPTSTGWYIYSEDGGTTWNFTSLEALPTLSLLGGLAICPRLVSGAIRVWIGLRTSATNNRRIYRSDNGGASFAHVATLPATASGNGPHTMICPYEGNTAGNIVWVSYDGSGSVSGVFKTTDGFSNVTQISLPGVDTGDETSRVKRLGIEIFAQDSNQIAIWTVNNRLFKSTDGTNFTEVSFTGYIPATHGDVMGAGGFPYAGSQYYIITRGRYIFVSTDGGATWIDKSGDFRTIATTNPGDPASGTRNGVVVPVWVAE